jgi:hypothetical protein
MAQYHVLASEGRQRYSEYTKTPKNIKEKKKKNIYIYIFFFFPYIFLGVFMYMEYLCRPSEASTVMGHGYLAYFFQLHCWLFLLVN